MFMGILKSVLGLKSVFTFLPQARGSAVSIYQDFFSPAPQWGKMSSLGQQPGG